MKIRLKWFQSAQAAVSDLLSVQKWLVKICVRAHLITTWTRKRGSIESPWLVTWKRVGISTSRNHVKFSQLSTRVGEGIEIGQNLVLVVIERPPRKDGLLALRRTKRDQYNTVEFAHHCMYYRPRMYYKVHTYTLRRPQKWQSILKVFEVNFKGTLRFHQLLGLTELRS